MKILLMFFTVVAIGLFFFLDYKPCIESHKEKYWKDSWVQLVPAGKVMVPIVHPAATSTRTVCDKYAS